LRFSLGPRMVWAGFALSSPSPTNQRRNALTIASRCRVPEPSKDEPADVDDDRGSDSDGGGYDGDGGGLTAEAPISHLSSVCARRRQEL
jgi:hypothetical protein